MMSASVARFAKDYRDALQDYLRDLGEAPLNRAYEMGRGALVAGCGILEVAAAHQMAVYHVLAIEEAAARADAFQAASRFLAECLSPFEMSHRGTREAALALQRLNET